MIGDVAARAGRLVVITGRSYDLGHAVSGVQFSLNEGASWTTYPFENTNDYQPVDWSFEFQPPRVGEYRLWVRSVNDVGATSPEAALAVIRATA